MILPNFVNFNIFFSLDSPPIEFVLVVNIESGLAIHLIFIIGEHVPECSTLSAITPMNFKAILFISFINLDNVIYFWFDAWDNFSL